MKNQTPETPQTIRQHKIHFYRQIAFTFIGAAIVVLAGLVYFSLSQAVILVTPEPEDVTADFHVLVKEDTDQTSEGISAKLHVIELTTEQGGDGELLEDGEPQQATGKVRLINNSSQPQPLVATTRLLSEEGILFRLKSAETVPANGEVEADVYADQEGKQGEIAKTRFTIPGLNQARQQEVYAVSDEKMTGGTKAVYQITQEAVNQALLKAQDELVAEAMKQLEASGINPDSLLPDAARVEVVEQTVDPEIGENAQRFTVKTVAQVALVQAFEEDLLELAQAQLYSTTSLGYELSSSDEGSFEYEVSTLDADKGIAQLHIVLDGQKRISSSHPVLDAANFVGEKPADIEKQLEENPGIKDVNIELRPFWLRRIPRLVDHIYVQFAS